MITREFEDIKTRSNMHFEKLFWNGVLGAMSLNEYIDGVIQNDSLVIATGTTDLGVNGQNVGGIDRTSIPLWTDTDNANVFNDLQELQTSFRGTNMSSTKVVMNLITFQEITKNEKIREELKHTNPSIATNGTIVKFAGITIEVYDKNYIDESGTAVWFIPDGYVIMVGSSEGGFDSGPVKLVEGNNLDSGEAGGSSVGFVKGDFIKFFGTEAPNVVSKGIYYSTMKLPVFENPKAFSFFKAF